MEKYYSWLLRLLESARRRSRELARKLPTLEPISEERIRAAEAPRVPPETTEGRDSSVRITPRLVAPPREGVGDLLQFPGSRRIQTTDVVVGFDFGTSCSKIIFQSPYRLGGRAVPVPFVEAGHSSCRYLVPAQVFLSAKDTVSLTPRSGWRPVRHLKVNILDRFSDQKAHSPGRGPGDPSLCTIAYIALLLREARRWFLTTQAEGYGNDEIRWSFNLGTPSTGYDDEAIRTEFKAIAKAAWLLSLEEQPLSLRRVLEMLEQTRLQKCSSGVMVDVVPEVAAQVVGYAKSKYREEGLHVLVDLGASTLDVCSFLLRVGDEGDIYTLLTADVRRLGLLELHSRRMLATRNQPPFTGLPEDLVQELPDWNQHEIADPALRHRLRDCDNAFIMDSVRVLLGTIRDLRQKRDPLSRRWNEGLPIFVSGGGSRSRIFLDFLNRANREAMKNWSIKDLRHRPVPALGFLGGDGAGLLPQVVSRLGVAYGLSHDAINIGKIEPPGDVPDIRLRYRRTPWEDLYIGKDQV